MDMILFVASMQTTSTTFSTRYLARKSRTIQSDRRTRPSTTPHTPLQQPPLEEAFARADELKVIVESEEDFAWAEENAARVRPAFRLYLQPEWSVSERVMPTIVEYAKAHPQWNISIQTHKYMHIP